MADGLVTDDVDVHYDVSNNNYCRAANCQNRRNNSLRKSLWFLVCIANVNNCKPCSPAAVEATVRRSRHQEVLTVEEITRDSSFLYYAVVTPSILLKYVM